MSHPFINAVVDLSHHNELVNFKKAAEGGIAIRAKAEFNAFDKLMLNLAKNGITKIPLTIIYT